MNLTRTFVTIACFLLFVTEVFAGDAFVPEPRVITEPEAGISVSSVSGSSAQVQMSGSLRVGGGIDFSGSFGAEVFGGFTAVSRSRISGITYYTGFSGFHAAFDMLWRAGTIWGLAAGPRFSWMTLSDTDHGFFFPSASVGAYLALPPGKDDSWHLRLTFRHVHHFRKDTAYSSTTGVGLSIIQSGGR